MTPFLKSLLTGMFSAVGLALYLTSMGFGVYLLATSIYENLWWRIILGIVWLVTTLGLTAGTVNYLVFHRNVIVIVALCFAACSTPDRLWSGRPAEEFQHDKAVCQKARHLDTCMTSKGWRVQTLEKR